jgi:hypothetical protein
VKIILIAGIVATGIFRVIKNHPEVFFSQASALIIDIAHLGFMMVYLLAALVFLVFGAKWVSKRAA